MSRLLTPAEVAELLQIRKAHVYRLARVGRIPAIQLGRYVRFDPQALELWIARQSQNLTEEEK